MKTLKEFDYDLWTTDENGKKRYFTRVKATGEVSEVSLEVMRFLRNEEKRMRRDFSQATDEDTILSIDVICTGSEADEAAWLVDPQDSFSKIFAAMDVDAFCEMLAPVELAIFRECMLGDKQKTVFAKEHGITKQSVQTMIGRIREKAKKYF